MTTVSAIHLAGISTANPVPTSLRASWWSNILEYMLSWKKGTGPAPRNPPLQWSGLKEASHNCATRLGKTSLLTRSPLVSSLYRFRMDFHALFTGANTPTSSGWRRWVVFGGRHWRMTLLALAFLISSKLIWEWWPSRKRMTGPLSVKWPTAPKKSLQNHDKKTSASIHPDLFTPYSAPTGPLSPSVHLLYKFLPLYKRNNGGSLSPNALPETPSLLGVAVYICKWNVNLCIWLGYTLDAPLLVKEEKTVVCAASVIQEHFAVCASPHIGTFVLFSGTVLTALLLLTLCWKMVKAEALATGWKKGWSTLSLCTSVTANQLCAKVCLDVFMFSTFSVM